MGYDRVVFWQSTIRILGALLELHHCSRLGLLLALLFKSFRSCRNLLLENLALRQQLAVLASRHPPPQFALHR